MTLNQTELAIRLVSGEKLKPVSKLCEKGVYCEFDNKNYPFFPFRYVCGDALNTAMEGVWENTEWEIYKELPGLKVDTTLIVWDDSANKYKRHFSHFDKDGKIVCFTGGKTSWTSLEDASTSWNSYTVVKEK